ncbi:MAG TPA: C25 family cysteine peptidase [Chryseosolibacter sp.]
MKRLVVAGLFLFLHTVASAQVGNEWINFSAPYYKIPVGKDGLYRLTRAQLLAAGVPSFIDPKTIKVYHRGIEQAIYVEGENDSQLNTNDFLEFFGRKNDGTLDQKLYTTPAAQPHPLYNLYSDTTAFFLTYGGAVGKRATSAALSTSNAAETFHWDEKLVVFRDQYSGGVDYGEVQQSAFENGEGWMSAPIFQGQTMDFIIPGITNAVQAAGVPRLEVVFTGRGPQTHTIEISAGPRLISSVTLTAYNSVKFQNDLTWADIVSGQFTLRVRVLGVSGQPARASVGYIRVTYPQSVTFDGSVEKYFTLNENASNASAVQIQSPPASAVLYDVSDPNNVIRIPVTQTTTLNAVVGQTSVRRKLFASNTFITPTIKRISFRQINPSAQDYVIISHALLRKPVAGYTDPVKALGEYRSLPQGGGYDTLIVNVDQLYNQFSYGEATPLAIYNFLKFLKTGKLPAYLFLVGKGLNIDYGYYRAPHTFPQFRDLVPTGGFPASDMRFSAGLANEASVPAVATGRLSATGPADVAAYLNKLKEFESQPFNTLRKKNILHLSGGLYAFEPQQFRSYLAEFGEVAKSFYLGGNVKAIAKQSTDIEVINVAEEVNQGLNLITLFGHSSPTSSDFDIGLVTDPVMGYNNKGKYPALLLNGCLAGSYFLNTSIFGENWTNTPDRGAIGVIAHSYFGFAPYLKLYSGHFYKVAFGDTLFIDKGLGDVQREVARRVLSEYGNNFVTETQVQQMVLLGDPAVSLFGVRKADLAVVPNSVSIRSADGAKLSAFSDSLELRFVIHNYGQAKNKSVNIRISRTLNDNSVVEYDSIIPATLYSDTILFKLPGRIDQGFGNNTFAIAIDTEDVVEELDEQNNYYSQVFFIPLSGTKNLYPDAHAIVSSLTPTLSFQHTDQLSGEREFLLEIDTVKEFTSAFRQQFTLKGKVLVSQKIDLPSKDSTVYYWRTRLAEPKANENTNWEVSSFTFINNGPAGWTQMRFGQFEENFLDKLEKDSQSKRIEFRETVTHVDVTAYAAGQSSKSSIKVNGAEINSYSEAGNFLCRDNTINLVAFDKTTTQPYAGLYFTWIELRDLFGSEAILCGREPYVINSFKASEVTMGKDGDLIKYISNIPVGDSVVLFTIGDAGIPMWPEAARTKMAELGVSLSQLDQLQAEEPVIIFARKGAAPGTARLYRGQDNTSTNQIVAIEGTVTGREAEGTMTSELIGPAQAWHDFKVRYKTDNPSDAVSFALYGINLLGNVTLLQENVLDDLSLQAIDANEFPYLRIAYATKDETFVTAAELKHWMVTYEPVAEGLLLFNGTPQPVTVSEGQSWKGNYSFVNISEKHFPGPLTVDYHVTEQATGSRTERTLTIAAPPAGATASFDVEFPTRNQVGVNDLFVFVNPRVRPENDFDNNFITLPKQLKVIRDTLAPLLEVTFDGRFIAHEEHVSPAPDIGIRLIDNNPFLMSSDTTGVKLFLQYPCEEGHCVFAPVYFSNPAVSWSPETTESEFEIHVREAFDVDGVYILRVIASDVSGNMSGAAPYEISFTVTHTNIVTISNPYPNPFSDRADFQIVIAGETVPSETTLTIFNTRGEIVRTFDNDSFGELRFGNNTFSWEGLTQNGTPVPNGMYIFKLRVLSDGSLTEKVGKLVLVR